MDNSGVAMGKTTAAAHDRGRPGCSGASQDRPLFVRVVPKLFGLFGPTAPELFVQHLAETPLAFVVLLDGLQQLRLAEIGPQHVGDVQFGVRNLP